MEYFRHIQLNAHLIRIIGLDETCFYLVNGSEKTVLLDAGSGYGDLKSYIEENRCYFLYLRFETEPITMFRVGAYRQEAEA